MIHSTYKYAGEYHHVLLDVGGMELLIIEDTMYIVERDHWQGDISI